MSELLLTLINEQSELASDIGEVRLPSNHISLENRNCENPRDIISKFN